VHRCAPEYAVAYHWIPPTQRAHSAHVMPSCVRRRTCAAMRRSPHLCGLLHMAGGVSYALGAYAPERPTEARTRASRVSGVLIPRRVELAIYLILLTFLVDSVTDHLTACQGSSHRCRVHRAKRERLAVPTQSPPCRMSSVTVSHVAERRCKGVYTAN
jgi:hypothetical protein